MRRASPLPPLIEPESAASADGPTAKGKRPWSKPTVRLHDGVTDVESGPKQHEPFNDSVDPIYAAYRPSS